MARTGITILGAAVGSLIAVFAMISWFGWGMPSRGQVAHLDPTRADYIDLLLTVVTILLGAIGLAVTVGALVIGLVAFKTLREIKTDAANEAKAAAAAKINETIAAELAPKVDTKVRDVLPTTLRAALLEDEFGHKILGEMAQRGELDAVFERVAMRIQSGGPESYPDQDVAGYNDESDQEEQ